MAKAASRREIAHWLAKTSKVFRERATEATVATTVILWLLLLAGLTLVQVRVMVHVANPLHPANSPVSRLSRRRHKPHPCRHRLVIVNGWQVWWLNQVANPLRRRAVADAAL
jgi:hypothetical protein